MKNVNAFTNLPSRRGGGVVGASRVGGGCSGLEKHSVVPGFGGRGSMPFDATEIR